MYVCVLCSLKVCVISNKCFQPLPSIAELKRLLDKIQIPEALFPQQSKVEHLVLLGLILHNGAQRHTGKRLGLFILEVYGHRSSAPHVFEARVVDLPQEQGQAAKDEDLALH